MGFFNELVQAQMIGHSVERVACRTRHKNKK